VVAANPSMMEFVSGDDEISQFVFMENSLGKIQILYNGKIYCMESHKIP